jgi:hypothetical protein
MTRTHSGPIASALVLLGCLVLAACGSTGQPSGTATGGANATASGQTRDIEFSDCMRSHGVPNFPDPTANGLQLPSGINAQSPAFRSAQQACKQFLPDQGAPRATDPHERAAALAFARCMRRHGLSQFPDPALTPPTHASTVFVLRGMVFAFTTPPQPKSPAFRRAAAACGLGRPGA